MFLPAAQDVMLNKAGGPLGLSIIGGSDHSCLPFGGDLPGTFVSKVGPPPTQRSVLKWCDCCVTLELDLYLDRRGSP